MSSMPQLRLAFDHVERDAIRPNCLVDPSWQDRALKSKERAAGGPRVVRSPGTPQGRLWLAETLEPDEFTKWVEVGIPAALARGTDPWFYPVGVVPRDFNREFAFADRIPAESLKALKNSNGYLLLDHSQEAMIPPENGGPWSTATIMITWCRERGLDPRKVIWLTPNFHIEPFFPDDSIRPLRFHFSLANVPSLYRGQLDDPEACPSA
ncbi:MAG: hypothetical protein GY798_19035, partial [Hyphomicrobiales bacterium]|nr:hypothetical protein [Hyphomicrobiales bacterium]